MSPYSSTSPHAIATLLARQSIGDEARQTLGSWDSCMSQAYCKWPVVAAIIIGGLIVLSLFLCIARFCCCGVECCCACCSCFNACCPKPRNRKTQYVEAPQYPPPQQYGYTPPMNYGAPAPQYASFDVSKTGRVKEDALPAMPSWQTSESKRIADNSYHDADALPAHDFGRGQQTGIAMGAVTPSARSRTRDDDPLYQDDDQLQPMLQQQQHEQRPISPYIDPPQADNYASAYSHDVKSNPFSPSSTTGSLRTQQAPPRNYNDYSQEQLPRNAAAYSSPNPQSPSSTYSSAYPQQYPSRAPTYRSQAPTYHTQAPAQNRVLSPTSPQADYNYGNAGNAAYSGNTGYTNNASFADFSRGQSQSTRYEPSTSTIPQSPIAHAELPGSLAIGGAPSPPAQRFYNSPQHEHEEVYEMSDSRSVYRQPTR